MAALHHADEVVREQAGVGARAWPRDQVGRAALLEALGDPSARVRDQAVWALGVRRDREARLALVACLGDPAPASALARPGRSA